MPGIFRIALLPALTEPGRSSLRGNGSGGSAVERHDGSGHGECTGPRAYQTDYEHRWLIDPRTGEVVFWTRGTVIDGENPVDLRVPCVLPFVVPAGDDSVSPDAPA